MKTLHVIQSYTQRGVLKPLVFKLNDGSEVTQYRNGDTFYSAAVRNKDGTVGTRALNRTKCPERAAQMQAAVDAWKARRN